MKIGTMEYDLSSANLNFLKAIGVNHICGTDYTDFEYKSLGYWDAGALKERKKQVEAHGIKLDMLALPLSSVSFERSDMPNIMLGTPERDGEIKRVNKCIQAAAKAGIPAVKINLTATGVLRTKPAVGRAGAIHTAFNLAEYQVPPSWNGKVSAQEAWERIAYFVAKVIPVAEAAGVRVACHPHDPVVPEGIGLDDRVLGPVEGLKKYCSLSSSPYHGLNFCQGCVEETGASQEEILDAIRYFGRQKRIFLVHFRTIRGGFGNFREAFIDDGQLDLVEAMKAYQEVGYEHMVVPDHYPKIPGDTPDGRSTRAYAVGYIKALIRATGGETE